ncbi:MAG: hypothetical protein QM756_25770 [Polyangiaceae bacterium]
MGWRVTIGSMMLCAVAGCGGQSEAEKARQHACDNAAEVQAQIAQAALVDMLESANICLQLDLVAASKGSARAAQYQNACDKYSEYETQCKG